MKILAILSMLWGTLWYVKRYIKQQKQQLDILKEWEKIFRCWKEWILRYRYSVVELIEHTIKDTRSSELSVVKQLQNHTTEEIITVILQDDALSENEKGIIAGVLKDLGSSLAESEAEELERKICKLKAIIEEKEVAVKERSALMIKLAPLLCGALAVILW